MAVVRLQCPACAAIVKITDELASQHPVVRCAQCQGLVQVAEHRLPDKAIKSSTEEKPRLKSGKRLSRKSSIPVGMIAGIVFGVVAFVGVGIGVYFLVTSLSSSELERTLKQGMALFDRCTQIFESINTAEDVPGAYDQLVKIGTELKEIANKLRSMKVDQAESERLRVKYEQPLKDKIQNMKTVALKLATKPAVMAALEKYEREHGFGISQLSGGLNLAGGPFGNAPNAGAPIDGKFDNRNAAPPKPMEASEQLQLEMALNLKKAALQSILDSLERVTDTRTLDFALVSNRHFLETVTQSNKKIEALEQKNVQPTTATSQVHVRNIKRLEGQLGVEVARLERLSDSGHLLNQLKTSFTSASIDISRSTNETANNGSPATTPSNPFEPSSGGNSATQGGNTPPAANPFEPATGSNAGNSNTNPFEPAPSKSGGSMPNRGSSALDATLGKLTGGDWVKKRDALNELQSAKVEDDRRKDVLDALFNLFDDKDIHSKVDVLKVYKKWASTQEQKERLGTIAESLLADTWVKKDILRFYADNKVVSASTEVARKLKDVFDRKEAAECLIAIGSEAEPAVLPHLTDLDGQVRHMAIEVLARIGTRKAVPELQKLNNDRQVGLAARQAIKIIMARK